MLLKAENIEKSFEGKRVLRGVSLALAAGEILVLLGPSGCGKTTLLRILAGLEEMDNVAAGTGRLLLNNTDLTSIPVHKRDFGFLFQDYALFPHKNVAQNVAFGLRMHHWSSTRIAARVQEVLTLVGLAGFGDRLIHELSGGEQQRVALARSLAPAPRLILLDEPLGALDRALRERLMLELRQILKQAGGEMGEEGITAVYVTHDQAEAFAIADRILLMNEGRVEQVGTPAVVYGQPATPFVARFLGMENIVTGDVITDYPLQIQTAIGLLNVASAHPAHECDFVEYAEYEEVTLLIRPEAARIVESRIDNVNEFHVRLLSRSFRGRYQIATILINDIELKLEFETAVTLPPVDSFVTISLDPEKIHLFVS